MIEKEYEVTGLTVKAAFTEAEVEQIFLPFLRKLIKLRKQKGKRLVIYLAGPPGTGKTTLSLFLEELFKELDTKYTFQSVSMDGFHHYNDYLDHHTISKGEQDIILRNLKGVPESFDFEKFKNKIKELLHKEKIDWPTYDRLLHDVSDKKMSVDADIVFIEGNYLLLNQEPWNELMDYCDYSIFIKTDLEFLKERLITRKQSGGSTFEEADLHYHRTDKVNAELVLNQSNPPDLLLYLTDEGRFNADFY